MPYTYVETPDHHFLMPRVQVEQIEPANESIAAMFLGDALSGGASWVKVTDHDGEFEVYRADRIVLGRRG